MTLQTNLARRLGLSYPIIQAPLAGGGDTPDLVAAVSNAGALGFIGAAYLTPEQIASTAAAVRAKTSRPFGINLFAPQRDGTRLSAFGNQPKQPQTQIEVMLERLGPTTPKWG